MLIQRCQTERAEDNGEPPLVQFLDCNKECKDSKDDSLINSGLLEDVKD